VALYKHRFSLQDYSSMIGKRSISAAFQIRRDRLVRKLSFARPRLMAIVLLPYRKTRRHGDSVRNYERSTNIVKRARTTKRSLFWESVGLKHETWVKVSPSLCQYQSIIKDFLKGHVRSENMKEREINENAEEV